MWLLRGAVGLSGAPATDADKQKAKENAVEFFDTDARDTASVLAGSRADRTNTSAKPDEDEFQSSDAADSVDIAAESPQPQSEALASARDDALEASAAFRDQLPSAGHGATAESTESAKGENAKRDGENDQDKAMETTGIAREDQTAPLGIDGNIASEGGATDAAAADTNQKNKESVDVKYLEDFAALIQKRADSAFEAVARAVIDRLPEELANKGLQRDSLAKASSIDVIDADALSKAITREANLLVEQLRREDKAVIAALKRFMGPEVQKQSLKAFKDSIDREIAKFRDGKSLAMAIEKAVEGRSFADSFAEGLRFAPGEAAVALQGLQPTRQQLQEAIRADLRQWCCEAIAQHCKSNSIFKDHECLNSTVNAMDAAMLEVASQGEVAFTKVVEETKNKVDPRALVRYCSAQVERTAQLEIERWQVSVKNRSISSAPATPAPGANAEALRARLRAVVRPVMHSMTQTAEELRSAAHSLDVARGSLEAVEAAAERARIDGRSAILDVADVSGKSIALKRKKILGALDSGQFGVAFEEALAWDAKHQEDELSLVELACDYLCSDCSPEEVLARPEVQSKLDNRVKLVLICALLQRAMVEWATLSRVENNLEWVLALLDLTGTEPIGNSFLAGLAEGRPERARIVATLEKLIHHQSPPALAEASPASRRQVITLARMVLKTLNVLNSILR